MNSERREVERLPKPNRLCEDIMRSVEHTATRTAVRVHCTLKWFPLLLIFYISKNNSIQCYRSPGLKDV